MNQFVIVCDGTYCYCQKSSNNKVQRKTYSCQKKRHLVKIFVICTSDGYIVDIFGPYAASDNDATILRDIIHKEILKNLQFLKKNTISKKPSTPSTPKGTPITNNSEILFNFRCFTSHLPEWGGFIDVKLEDFDNISFENFQHFNKTRITNTCTIDYFLFGFWYAYYLSKNSSVYFNNEDNCQCNNL